MFEKYNHLATYCFRLCRGRMFENGSYDLNTNYFIKFTLVCSIIGFLYIFITSKFDDEFKEDFGKSFGIAIICGIVCGLLGCTLLATLWSILLFYIFPFIILCFLFFKIDKIIKHIVDKFKPNKVKNTIEDIKYEEIAKEIYESMKCDFPELKYETVFKSVKNKL
jgi:hypothetical protein